MEEQGRVSIIRRNVIQKRLSLDGFKKDEKGTTVSRRGRGLEGVCAPKGKVKPQSIDPASSHFKGDHSKGTNIWQLMP